MESTPPPTATTSQLTEESIYWNCRMKKTPDLSDVGDMRWVGEALPIYIFNI